MEQQSIDNMVYVHKLEPVCVPPSSADIARSARELLRAVSPTINKKKIVIKPNITVPAEADSGIVTHPDFVAGMIDYFTEVGMSAEDIIIAEGGGSGRPPDGMDKYFGQSGYTAMAQSRGIRLANMNWDEKVTVHVPQAEILKEIGIAKTVKDDVYFINVPKYKTHNLAVTTLSMKNLMGTITPCHERHLCILSKEFEERGHEITPGGITLREDHLCRKICDLSLASKPDLNIIDGIIGRDGTAFRRGKNIQTNLVIAGKSVVSVDAVGSYLMGFDPSGIGYLRIASERGLGVIDIEKIGIREVSDGQLVPCGDVARFMSRIPFDVLNFNGERRDIPLNREMLACL